MTSRMKTMLIVCASFAAGSWFGDDIVQQLFQPQPSEERIDVGNRIEWAKAKVEPHMQQIYALLENPPARYQGVKMFIDAVPYKDRIECKLMVTDTEEEATKVIVWNDGRVTGGWHEPAKGGKE